MCSSKQLLLLKKEPLLKFFNSSGILDFTSILGGFYPLARIIYKRIFLFIFLAYYCFS